MITGTTQCIEHSPQARGLSESGFDTNRALGVFPADAGGYKKCFDEQDHQGGNATQSEQPGPPAYLSGLQQIL